MAEAEYKQFLQAYGYILGEKIGKGTFGVVFRCTKVSKNGSLETFAVKVVDIRRLKLETKTNLQTKIKRLEREISVMKKLSHKNIVKLHDVYRTKEAFFLVMDLVLGIDLFEMIIAENGLKRKLEPNLLSKDIYDEKHCAEIYVQVVDSIQYMHDLHIIHRDIKPENIILQADNTTTSPFNVKLIDFGLSKVITDNDIQEPVDESMAIGLMPSKAKSLVGTPKYIAPEIVRNVNKSRRNHEKRKEYNTKVDCYSMGVLLHVMLGACFPQFVDVEDPDIGMKTQKSDKDSQKFLARNVRDSIVSQVVFQDERIKDISEEAKDLIVKLLEPHPEKRLSMAEVKEHPWLLKNLQHNSLHRGTKRHTETEDTQMSETHDLETKLRKMNTRDSIKHIHLNEMDKMDTADSVESIKFQNSRNMSTEADALLMLNRTKKGETLEDPQRILHLQAKIATYLKAAYNKFLADEAISPHIVSSAVGSRELLRVTSQLLTKLEQTAASTLAMLPDLQLAVEEEEYEMASSLFGTIKSWIDELKGGAASLLQKNSKVMQGIDCAIAAIKARKRVDSQQAMQKFIQENKSNQFMAKVNEAIRNGTEMTVDQMTALFTETNMLKENAQNSEEFQVVNFETAAQLEAAQLIEALEALQQVDRLLQRHATFWSQMEVLIQILQQRANHVNSMTKFTRNPKLRGRFIQRLDEYARTWDNVRLLCQRFNLRARSVTPALYAFLSE